MHGSPDESRWAGSSKPGSDKPSPPDSERGARDGSKAFCASCGSPVAFDDRYCGFCGVPRGLQPLNAPPPLQPAVVHEPVPQAAPPPPPPSFPYSDSPSTTPRAGPAHLLGKMHRTTLSLVAIGGLLLLGGVVVFFVTSNSNSRGLANASHEDCRTRGAAIFDYLRSGNNGGDTTLDRDFGNQVGGSDAQARAITNAAIVKCDTSESQSAKKAADAKTAAAENGRLLAPRRASMPVVWRHI